MLKIYLVISVVVLLVLMSGFLVYYSNSTIRNTTNHIVLYENFTGSNKTSFPVHQYDLNINHTYIIPNLTYPVNLNVSDAIYATPTIYNRIMYVTTMGSLRELEAQRYDKTTGKVIAIDMQSNKVLWSDNFSNQIMSQPIIAGNVLVVAMGNNQEVPPQFYNENNAVIGIDMENGKVLWIDNMSSSAMTTPAYFEGNVIGVTMMGEVYIINASTGKLLNASYLRLPDLLSSPLLVNGTVYVGGSYSILMNNGSRQNFGSFFAINALTGSLIWKTDFPNASAGLNDICPTFHDGIIVAAYLADSVYNNPTLVAMNATTGKVLWELNETEESKIINVTQPQNISGSLNFTENTLSPLVFWDGDVLSDSNFLGILFAVNITTGKVVWAVDTGQSEGPPNVIDGKYLITMNDAGDLFVINATNGSVLYDKPIGIPRLASQIIITKNYAIISGMNGDIESIPINLLV